jgi:hypothetical protein
MRAHNITTTTRRRRRGRRRVIALALGVCALAIPASASAYTDPGSGYASANAITGGSEQSSQPPGDSDHSSVNAITGGSDDPGQSAGAAAAGNARRTSTELGQSTAGSQSASVQPPHGADYSSVSAITGPSSEPTLVSGSPASAADGFDWGDAALGAGATIALVALGGAALVAVRRRAAMSPTASTG